MTLVSLYKREKKNGRKKKWHSTRSTLNLKSSSCREANSYVSVAVIRNQVCKGMRATKVIVPFYVITLKQILRLLYQLSLHS